MSVIKKGLFYAFIVASFSAAIWAYLRLKESKEPAIEIIEHIPKNAHCVIETNDFNGLMAQLTRQNLIWKAILHTTWIQSTQRVMTCLDSLIKSDESLSELMNHNRVYWSCVKDGKTTHSILQCKAKEKNDESKILHFFKSAFTKEEAISSFETYSFSLAHQKWLACYKDGMLYLTSDLSLLETCVHLQKTESLANHTAYLNLRKLNGRQNNHVYINPTSSTLFNKQVLSQPFGFNTDITLNQITFNGYMLGDSMSCLSVTKQQKAQVMANFQNLPNHPASLTSMAVSDGKTYYHQLQKVIPKNIAQQNGRAWKTLNDSALYPIDNEVFENMNGEVTIAKYMSENSPSSITAINFKEGEKIKQWLALLSDSTFEEAGFKIYKLHNKYSHLFYTTPQSIPNQFAFETQNTVFLLSDQQVLNYAIQCFLSGNLLGKNTDFMNYLANHLGQECHYFYYENAQQTHQYHLPSFINLPELMYTDHALSQLSLTAKWVNNNIQWRVNLHQQHEQPTSVTSNHALWSFKADTLIKSPIYLFTNHTTQEHELCFQDQDKQLYLVTSTGNLLWKKTINETIQSEIYTVDLFKNGKLQMLFNSENYLHLIDRNGHDVQGFPVKLPAKVTSNITLLDYHNTKEYRIFIACSDKKIYNYSLYGVKTEGFTPFKTSHDVKLPVYYAKVGLSDYLITADVSGKVYAFSRKGEGRIELKEQLEENLSSFYVDAGNTLHTTKVVYINHTKNALDKISLDNTTETLPIKEEIKNFRSCFGKLNEGSLQNAIVYGKHAIYAYDLFSSKVFQYVRESAFYNNIQIMPSAGGNIMLAFDEANQTIDIIGPNGKWVKNITQASQVPLGCQLYKTGKNYVLVAHGTNLKCYEAN